MFLIAIKGVLVVMETGLLLFGIKDVGWRSFDLIMSVQVRTTASAPSALRHVQNTRDSVLVWRVQLEVRVSWSCSLCVWNELQTVKILDRCAFKEQHLTLSGALIKEKSWEFSM